MLTIHGSMDYHEVHIDWADLSCFRNQVVSGACHLSSIFLFSRNDQRGSEDENIKSFNPSSRVPEDSLLVPGPFAGTFVAGDVVFGSSSQARWANISRANYIYIKQTIYSLDLIFKQFSTRVAYPIDQSASISSDD